MASRILMFFMLTGVACLGAISHAEAAPKRHALVIGLGDYNARNGMNPLKLAGNDADEVAKRLTWPGFDYQVAVYKDSKIKTKADFDKAISDFAGTILEGDEVLVYISSHGHGSRDKGNHYLAPDAISREEFVKRIKDKDPEKGRSFETDPNRADGEWLALYGVSEDAIERKIRAERKTSAFILIADACRNYASSAKGATLITGLGMPATQSKGVFRFYATSAGEAAYDEISTKEKSVKGKEVKAQDEAKPTSLFTTVLLRHIGTVNMHILSMAERVRLDVNDLGQRFGRPQNPDYQSALMVEHYALMRGEELISKCSTADHAIKELQKLVALGKATNKMLQDAMERLSPCGKSADIVRLIAIFSQGLGKISGMQDSQLMAPQQRDMAVDECDALAASPLDPNRPQNVTGIDIQSFAVAALTDREHKDNAAAGIQVAIDACLKSINARKKVARFHFNLGRAYYAMATVSEGENELHAWRQSFASFREAVNRGYIAAYTNFATFFDHGQVVEADPATGKLVRLPGDRQRALEYYMRGAELGHLVAQYQLGLIHKNGLLGQKINRPKAYALLSQAAEAGYIPAMIEAAELLRFGYGAIADIDPKRAIQLLETAAERGSVAAMYHLGDLYYRSQPNYDQSRSQADRDPSRAVLWFARAAEMGDERSQVHLARMLTWGLGVPAAQPEAAGRYWRIAAASGNPVAQVEFAGLLRSNKVQFRPDKGPDEIVQLYKAGIDKEYPVAANKLAALYSTGYKFGEQVVIARDDRQAIAVAEKAIELVDKDLVISDNSNPDYKLEAVGLMLDISEKTDSAAIDDAVLKAKIDKLRKDYGEVNKRKYINFDLGRCSQHYTYNFPLWDWQKDEAPTEMVFKWFDKRYGCNDDNIGVHKECRKYLSTLYQQSRSTKKSFVQLVTDKYQEFWNAKQQQTHGFFLCFSNSD